MPLFPLVFLVFGSDITGHNLIVEREIRWLHQRQCNQAT